jgi:Xaa-Pro aminopeptidase
LGLLKPKDLKVKVTDPSKKPVKKWFMHGNGHPIGLDVHDLGHMNQPFAVGWVMTVEPAIYIPEEDLAVRLENDVIITENGPVDLMADIPIEAEEIESMMK